MVRRLWLLVVLAALWPGLALAQSDALKAAQRQFTDLVQQGQLAAAEPFAREAVRLAEEECCTDDVRTRYYLYQAIVNLAVLYRAQGRHAEAAPLFERALAIQDEMFRRDQPTAAMPTPSRSRSAPLKSG